MLYFKDNHDGYYQFDDSAPPESYAHLMPTAQQFPNLSETKAAKIAELTAARDAAINADITVAGVTHAVDERFKTYISRLNNQVGRGKQIPAGDLIRDKNRGKPTINATILGQIEDAATVQEAAAWTKFNGLVDQVMAAPDVAAVEAIVW